MHRTNQSRSWKKREFLRLLTTFVCVLVSGATYPRIPNAARAQSLQYNHAFALRLYDTILNAAESSKGLVQVKLKPFNGRTNGARTGQSAFWRVSPETTAQITFDLRNNRWEKLSVDFGEHPLIITLAVDTPIPGTLRVGKITYDHNGRVKDLYEPGSHSATTDFVRKGQTHADSLGFYSEALTQLKIAPQVVSLLTDQNLNTGPLRFDSVEIRENSQDGLQVDLRAGTKLPLGISNSSGCDFDSLNLTEKTSLSFSALSYEASTKNLAAAINRFTANASDACLTSGNTLLKMGPGGHIEISQLAFGQRSLTSPFLSLKASQIDSLLAAGSSLVLTQSGERQSAISPIDVAGLKADRLGFEVKEDGSKVLSLGSAQVSLGSATGILVPDPNNHLSFKTPRTALTIVSAEWTTNSLPKLQGSLSPMQIALTSGDLVFGSANKLSIQSGTAETGQFTIDTSRPVPIFGEILPTSLALGRESIIGTTNRFVLEAQGGALIANPANRITFSSDNPGTNGQIALSIPNTKGKINFGNDLQVVVNSGSIEAVLARLAGGGFSGQIKGHLMINSGRVPLGLKAAVVVGEGKLAFDNLTFSDSDGLMGPLTDLRLNLGNSDNSLSSSLRFTPADGALIDLSPGASSPEIANSGLKGTVRINAPFSQGEASFTAGGNFKLGNGIIEGTILAADNAPAGGTVRLTSDLTGGAVVLDSATTLSLAGGSKINSGSLSLNPDGSLSGPIPNAHFQLDPGAPLIATRGRKLTIEIGSSYDSKEGAPLLFSVGEDSPTGEGELIAKFTQLTYPNTATVSLRNGELRSRLSRISPGPLQWHDLSISGQQIGSYASIAEMPDDEYTILTRFPSGSTQSISAPNRVMIVNTVPIAINTKAAFDSEGVLSRAILAEDTTVFGIPLAGGSPVEVDPSHSVVLVGTIGRDTTIDGIPYSKGCLAHLPPTELDHKVPPCELITSLAFRIKTSNDLFSGAYAPLTNSKDDIWIDIGPKAWRIPNDSKLSNNMRISGDFGKGETATIEIVNPAIGEGGVCSALDGPDVQLFVGDLRGVRLEKKGIFVPNICGLAEGPDTEFDLVPNPLKPPRPSDILNNLKAGIQLKREELELKRNGLKLLQNKLNDLQPAINEAEAKIKEFLEKRNTIRDFNNSLIEKKRQVGELLCSTLNCPFNEECTIPVHWPFSCPDWAKQKIPLPCPLRDTCNALNNEIANLEKGINNAQSWLEIHAAEESIAAGVLATKLSLEGSIRIAETEIEVFNSIVDAAQPVADDLQKLIDQLIPDIDIPLPGQWKPESITVIVNGRDFVTFTINQRLKQGQSEWESGKNGIRPMSAAEYFVHGLRVNITKGDGSDDYMSFIATPAAKMRGFSGWDQIDDVKNVTAIGILQHPPSFGLDAGVSLDLKINQIDVDGQMFILDGTKGIRHERFIRVEYRFGTDERWKNWHVGDTIRVTGPIKRDRDRTTFYEIHPLGQSNIERISH